MPKKGYPKYLFRRFHRYHKVTGKRQIKRFDIDVIPTNDDPNYTDWQKGNGPMSPEHYEKVITAVKNSVTGKPKSEETKEKMRQAKLGVKKTPEHRAAMSLAQKTSDKAKLGREKMWAANREIYRKRKLNEQ